MITRESPLKCFVEILLTKYFLDAKCVYIISEPNVVIDLSLPLPIITLAAENLTEHFLLAENSRCEIFIMNSFQLFETIEYNLKRTLDSLVRFNDRKYVLLPTRNFTTDVYESQHLNYVVNVLIIEERKDTYVLWTHDYYKRNNPIFLDVYYLANKTFKFGRNLYPDKLSNQMGKTLRIGALKPYDTATIELQLLNEYVKRRNMTQEFIILPQASWGFAYDNFTASGLRKLLLDERVDIITGFNIMSYDFIRFHDPSQSFVRMGVTCLVPKPKIISAWYIFKYTFHYNVWILYVMTFILSCVLLTVLMGKSTVQLSINCMLAIFLEQSFRASAITNNKQKIFIATASIMVLILNTAFSSRLSSILIKPRYADKINNIDDLDKSRLEWGNYNDKVLRPIKESYYDLYKDLIDRHMILSQREIEEKLISGNFALLMGRELIDIRLNTQFSRRFIKNNLKDYRIMREDLYALPSVLMLRRNCVFLDSLNTFILQALDTGLISHWNNKLKLEYKSYNILKSERYDGRGILNLIELVDAFAILLLGNLIAICVFVLECIYRKCNKYFNNKHLLNYSSI